MGLRIGKGETLKQIISDMTAVAEGVLTARSAHMLAKKLNVQVSLTSLQAAIMCALPCSEKQREEFELATSISSRIECSQGLQCFCLILMT